MRFNVFNKQAGVKNHEGALAFRMDDRMELYSTLVTTALGNKFYESANERINRIRELIAKNDPAFVAKLAIYARTKMNLRSVPLVLAVELAKIHSGNAAVRKTVSGVVKRADEITELLAYYQAANQRSGIKKLNKLSKQIQHGLAVAFNAFDEYQFAKYDRTADITLRDALFLVHPKAMNDQQQLVFDKIAKRTLQVPYTWETELSALGQQKFADASAKAAAFRTKWEELIASNKLGYMALLRNLRNILEAEVSIDAVAHVCAQLADPVAVAKSKQLPFRFLAAWREVKVLEFGAVPLVLDALENAVSHSAQNIRGFDRHTSVMIACDVSGSMQKAVSAKSKVMNYDIGLMLAMLLQSRCQHVQTGMFGDTWKIINVSRKNILANVQEFYSREGEVGYATNGYLVLKDLLERKQAVDKVMMFTDCQLWNNSLTDGILQTGMTGLWKRYKAMVPHAKLYLFDLAGYGHTPISIREHGVHLIAGWSEKVFDVLAAIEDGKNALSEIENVVI